MIDNISTLSSELHQILALERSYQLMLATINIQTYTQAEEKQIFNELYIEAYNSAKIQIDNLLNYISLDTKDNPNKDNIDNLYSRTYKKKYTDEQLLHANDLLNAMKKILDTLPETLPSANTDTTKDTSQKKPR